jgi:phytoene synthase
MSDFSPPSPAATPPADVRESLRYCHRVTRSRARNFYYGLKLTPEPRRSALYAVYAYMRACDDLVDAEAPASSVADASRQVDAFREATHAAADPAAPLPDGPIWPAVRHVIRTYRLDTARFDAMLDGQRMDLTTRRYADFSELYTYCYRVASVVGLVCLDVWGHDGDKGVPKLAEYRGIAFQLTNVLRDLVEDAERGRVYLPQDELQRFDVSADDLRHRRCTPGFERLLTFQIERARSYYQMSEPLERHIDPRCRATSWAMTQIYRRLLERIAMRPAAVLSRRVRLGSLQKCAIAVRATWKRTWV